jgi:hypothetical protein
MYSLFAFGKVCLPRASHQYDRVIINGTAGGAGCTWGYAGGMTCFFNMNHLRVFDFATVFKPVSEKIIANAQELAARNGLEIEYIRKPRAFRKEDRIAEILARRGTGEGLVHIFSCLELSETYKPWHDREGGGYYFNKGETKCLCYYFYFIDKELGLCFMKVPTIAPFRLTFYFNGHSWLEYKLGKRGIGYRKEDNAYVYLQDYRTAQELSDRMRVEDLHRTLDIIAGRYCLGFISAFDDTCNGVTKLDKLTGDVKEKERTHKGFNVFDEEDERILLTVGDGKYNLRGISNKALRQELPEKSAGQISRTLKRLRLHGLIKKIGRTYLYYLTEFGKQVIVTCLKLKNMFLVPELSHA